VSAYDPVVKPSYRLPVRIASDAYAAAEGADAVVVATEWPSSSTWTLPLRSAMKGRPALRRAQLLSPTIVGSAGFVYEGVGGVHRVVPEGYRSRRRRSLPAAVLRERPDEKGST